MLFQVKKNKSLFQNGKLCVLTWNEKYWWNLFLNQKLIMKKIMGKLQTGTNGDINAPHLYA